MKKLLLTGFAFLSFAAVTFAQKPEIPAPYIEQLNGTIQPDGNYGWSYKGDGLKVDDTRSVEMTKSEESVLSLDFTNAGGAGRYVDNMAFILNNGPAQGYVDVSEAPVLHLRARSTEAVTLVIALQDTNGVATDGQTLSFLIPAGTDFNTYTQNFATGDFVNHQAIAVDPTAINQLALSPNKGAGTAYNGTLEIDWFVIAGQEIVTTGAFSAAPAAAEGIFPNPASEVATVNYSASSNAVVTVSDLAGNVVRTVNGTTSTASVNVADLTAGIYFVSVTENGTPVSNHKLVVK